MSAGGRGRNGRDERGDARPGWEGREGNGGAMGRLTTHVLDTARGMPGSGIRVELYGFDDDGDRRRLAAVDTNSDGRCDAPLLEGEAFRVGRYEIVFAVGPYFERAGWDLPDPAFLDEVRVRFAVAAPDEHYHVPILVSPWSYTTYRGS